MYGNAMSSDVAQAVSRVRRAMPRNADVMIICDELERLMSRPATVVLNKRKLTRAEIQRNYRLRQKEAKQ